MIIKKLLCGCLLTALIGVAAADDKTGINPILERGRYLVVITGCNNCHTPGYPESGGTLPVTTWLTGATVGFQGPWGTTYPTNLRLLAQTISEDEWLNKARKPMRPPMPWPSMRSMTDSDLKAIYQFIRSLGPLGTQAPPYARPGQAVNTPFIEFVPKSLPKQTAGE